MAQLTFTVLDGIIFAATRQRLSNIPNNVIYAADDLGPFLELCHFSTDEVLPDATELSWLHLSGLSALATAIASGRNDWVSPDGGKIGFLRPKASETEKAWNAFAVAAHKASLSAGISSSTTAQLIGALGEMRSNLHEHSEAIESGLIAFRARPKIFEFVVADHGIGVLRSLKSCGYYRSLDDNGEALRLMLTENVSRFGPNSDRGKGFRPLFIGLANMKGALRFRSGDHSLVIEGINPTLLLAKTAQKPELKGFFASIKCQIGNL